MNVRNPSSWFWMLLCISSSVSASLSLPHGWRRTAPVDDHTPLSLLLALSSDISVEELEEALYDVSDPLSPNKSIETHKDVRGDLELTMFVPNSYGHYLSVHEYADRFGAPNSSIDKVKTALRESCGGSILAVEPSLARDWVKVELTSKCARQLFKAQVYHHVHDKTGAALLAANQAFVVPPELHDVVYFIDGYNYFPSPQRKPKGVPLRSRVKSPHHPQQLSLPLNVPFLEDIQSSETQLFIRVSVNTSSSISGYSVSLQQVSTPNGSGKIVGMPFTISIGPPVSVQADPTGGSCMLNVTVPWGPNTYTNVTVSAQFPDTSTSPNVTFPSSIYTFPDMTIDRVKELYGVPLDLVATNPSNVQSIVAFEVLGQSIYPPDITNFFAAMHLNPSLINLTFVGPNTNVSNNEPPLDLEWIMGMGLGVPTVQWSVPKPGLFLAFFASLQFFEEIPLVFSISDCGQEDAVWLVEEKTHDNITHVERFYHQLRRASAAAGLRGSTVLVAAGDAGASQTGTGNGQLPGNTCNRNTPLAGPDLPTVTSVGSTMLLFHEGSWMYEIPSSAGDGLSWTTGGAFSYVYPRPRYQNNAIYEYLSQERMPPRSFFDVNGRAYPDVTAIGSNIPFLVNGEWMLGGGTSASTPLTAGIVSLINDARLNAGKPPVGFLNPALYNPKRPNSVFSDVVEGSNRCGESRLGSYLVSETCCTNGFSATNGFDAASGWGSPNWDAFLSYMSE